MNLRFFWSLLGDQNAPKVSKIGDFEDLGHFDGYFSIIIPHVILFWIPCNPTGTQEWFSGFFGHLWGDQDAQKAPKMGEFVDFCHFDGDFPIKLPHIIPFCIPCDPTGTQEWFSGFWLPLGGSG